MTLHIKKFMDKMAAVESKQAKDVVLTIADARGLRDDIAKLLADLHDLHTSRHKPKDEVIKVEVKGGTFK